LVWKGFFRLLGVFGFGGLFGTDCCLDWDLEVFGGLEDDDFIFNYTLFNIIYEYMLLNVTFDFIIDIYNPNSKNYL
jgi:hypothetical protein